MLYFEHGHTLASNIASGLLIAYQYQHTAPTDALHPLLPSPPATLFSRRPHHSTSRASGSPCALQARSDTRRSNRQLTINEYGQRVVMWATGLGNRFVKVEVFA